MTSEHWRITRDEWGYKLILVRPGGREFPLLGAHFRNVLEAERALRGAPMKGVSGGQEATSDRQPGV